MDPHAGGGPPQLELFPPGATPRPAAPRPIARLRPGDAVHGIFVCAGRALARTREGRAYLSLTLYDGRVTFRAHVFHRAAELERAVACGDALRVRGTVVGFGGTLEVRVAAVEPPQPRRPLS
jgi:hypothetical protein